MTGDYSRKSVKKGPRKRGGKSDWIHSQSGRRGGDEQPEIRELTSRAIALDLDLPTAHVLQDRAIV
jgi:hypothetical protein